MKATLLTSWLFNLRNKKYNKTTGVLRRDVGDKPCFCCLGVLCDIVDNTKWNIYDCYQKMYQYDQEFTASALPIINNLSTTEISQLCTMNDSGKTFEQIADWIEQNVPIEED